MLFNFFTKLFPAKEMPNNKDNATQMSEDVAFTTLLIRVARTDNDFTDTERSEIIAILHNRYGYDVETIDSLMEKAEILEAKPSDVVSLTQTINNTIPYENRPLVVRAFWQVTLADGTRNDDENGFMRLTSDLLGISDQDSALIRQSVIAAKD